MIPVKAVFTEGRTLLLGRMPGMRISSGMQLRNKTAHLWNKRFSRGLSQLNPSDKRTQSSSIVSKAKVAASKKHVTAVPMKWAVLTGVTLMIGTMLLVSRTDEFDDDGNDANNELKTKPKRTHRIKIFNNNWLFFCYSTLPLNAISRLWGKVNSLTLPMWLRPIGFNFYTFLFGVDINEMADPNLYHYENLSQFFYRDIKPELRPIAPGSNVVASPSDGEILQFGIIDSETGVVEQVKGLTYSIKEFLGTHAHPLMSKSESSLNLSANEDEHIAFAEKNHFTLSSDEINDVSSNERILENELHINDEMNFQHEGDKSLQNFDSGASKTLQLLSELSLNIPYFRQSSKTDPRNTKLYFAVIYLSPGDYHHYHSPVDWVCKTRRHFPGELFSVSPYFQHNFPNLFILNERVSLLGYWKHGFFSMTPVGATNVGSIQLTFDKELVTNVKRRKNMSAHTCYEATYSNASRILGGMPLVKGEEMGGFKLGSTVVLCFEAPSDFKFNIKIGSKVKMGQKLGSTASDD